MTDTTPDDQLDIIDEHDREKTLVALLAGAGTDGVSRPELERQYLAAIDWVADQKLGTALYNLVMNEGLALRVDEQGGVRLHHREGAGS